MSNSLHRLQLQSRLDVGKGASRRLRRRGMVPGIIYGGHDPAIQVMVAQNVLNKKLEEESFYSHIITLDIDGQIVQGLLKDLQRHPFKPMIMHFDFQRITGDDTIHRHVPLHFINEDIAVGVKMGGGTLFHQLKDVEIVCKVSSLPEFIEVDVANLAAGHSLHLSDLVLPEGVVLPGLALGPDHDLLVVSIQTVRAQAEVASSDESSGTAGN